MSLDAQQRKEVQSQGYDPYKGKGGIALDPEIAFGDQANQRPECKKRGCGKQGQGREGKKRQVGKQYAKG